MKDKYFKLFPSCIPVKGQINALIYDLSYGRLIEISDLLYDVLSKSKALSIQELKSFYQGSYDAGINAYFDLFVDQEIGFRTASQDSYPEIAMNWASSFYIENSIIEYQNHYDLDKLLNKIDKLGCRNLQLRLLPDCQLSISRLTRLLENKSFTNIELYIPCSLCSSEKTIALYSQEKSISRIYMYGATDNEILYRENVFAVSGPLVPLQLEKIGRQSMATNIKLFSEAKHFNTALNRKISIDSKGNIKNFLSHSKIFGNIKTDDLESIYESKEFQKKWHIKKNSIRKCKTCKFRYACVYNTDLRPISSEEWEMIDPCSYEPSEDSWFTK